MSPKIAQMQTKLNASSFAPCPVSSAQSWAPPSQMLSKRAPALTFPLPHFYVQALWVLLPKCLLNLPSPMATVGVRAPSSLPWTTPPTRLLSGPCTHGGPRTHGGPLSFTASSSRLLSQTCPQGQVHDDGSTSVPSFKGLSKLLKSRPPQGDAVGWKGPGGQAQTPVRPVGVKPQFCSPADPDFGQVICLL